MSNPLTAVFTHFLYYHIFLQIARNLKEKFSSIMTDLGKTAKNAGRVLISCIKCDTFII